MVIGGGTIAERKVRGLLEAGAHVMVVSPATTPLLAEFAERGQIDLLRRPYRDGDLAGAWLAVAATDDRTTNGSVWAEAERRNVPLNAVDDLEHCSFIAPAVHRAGDITVAVSTGGKSPALAARLRDRLARLIGRAEARLCKLLGELRQEVALRVPDTRARTALWYRIVDSNVLEFVRRDDLDGARKRIEDFLYAPGTVYLVGAGPGDPGLITVKGLEILRSADVVVYDRLVPRQLIDEAPPWAERIFAGKSSYEHRVGQDAINALLIDRARRGRVVVRLKGGDPFVFGRGAEERDALHAKGVAAHVVPGVTSAIAVPAAAGIPVTDRRYASGFGVVTGHECDGDSSDLDWSALARLPTLVVLMGLRALPEIAARLIGHGANPDTPAAVIASGTMETERRVVGTLETIADLVREAELEPPATVIVGEVVRLSGQDAATTFAPSRSRSAVAVASSVDTSSI